jgi:hypothetical protein
MALLGHGSESDRSINVFILTCPRQIYNPIGSPPA